VNEYADNVWADLDDIEAGIRGKRLRRTEGNRLAAAVWELAAGSDGADCFARACTSSATKL